MNTVLFLLLLVLVPVFISTMFIPYWTRRTESFGVSIPEKYFSNENLKQMRKQYVLETGILSVITAALLIFFTVTFDAQEKTISVYFSVLTFAYILLSFLIYLRFHRKMIKVKEQEGLSWSQKSQRVVINTKFRNQKITYSNLWFLISFAIALGTLLLTLMNYEQIPNRVPTKYDFSGEVTNWTEKSYRSVLVLPIMQMYLTLLFMFVNLIISKAKQQVSVEDPKASQQKNAIFRRRWSAYIIISGIALTAMFSMLQLSMIHPINHQFMVIVPLVFSLCITLGAIWLSITTGQGGSRLVTTGKNNTENVINRDDDKHWKLGVFYFNKNDPAIFLEKRFGVGWTNNWAHPLSWIIIIAIILLAVGIPFLLTV